MCCHWLKLKGAASVCKEEGYLNVHVHKKLNPTAVIEVTWKSLQFF